MALSEIGQPGSWDEAFAEARKLQAEGELTAIAIVSEKEYANGSYIATHLQEFAPVMSAEDALDNLRLMSPSLYGEANRFRLLHGPAKYLRPDGMIDGWMFVIVWKQ